ncbi:GNAT family N-acetyltransferase [Deinococcus deserti]|uniref:Putative acetyltransferase n=1 Tax=Deinococcus deserti (strain DSM 17065 / CIP 109153 / LMG 22923 / VCD115) TaxID=546414 RepID=C1D2U5_DEIDV|nr:GNAT family N-acetyltransferase [Deinococcus deserti]ACO47734.1 putative acetyltransferase [Deinococcus deserti VCD115]
MTPRFDFQPTLSGARVTLRPLKEQDFGPLYAAASDPLIWEQHPDNRHEPAVFRAYFDGMLASGGALLATEASTGTVIGASRFHSRDIHPHSLEIGWTFLARSYWGGTYNGDMKRLMLGHAFHFVDHVVFLVASQNLRSQRAVQKIGGQLQEHLTEGRDQGYLVFRVDRSTWAGSP